MNFLLQTFLSLLIFSIISVQLTSSASFPNPPQFPAPNASANEWTLFWKLLHNYYAIIARPRFGKRYDSIITQSKHPTILEIINSNPVPSANEINNNQQFNMDDFYIVMHSDRRRHRR